MRARRPLAVATVLLASAAAAPPAATAYDLTVTSLEVTQGIQTPANSIRLVARRSTAVRATVAAALRPGETLPRKVTGRLHVFRDNVRITPPRGVPPLSSMGAPPTAANRDDATHTLNFELRAPTPLRETANLDVRVRLTPLPGEASTTNNTGTVDDLRVTELQTPRIFYVRVDYRPHGRGFPAENLIGRGVGDMLLRGILPVNDADSRLYRPLPLAPDLTLDRDINGDGQLNDPDDNLLLARLATLRQLLVITGAFGGPGVPSNSYVYAWLAGEVPGNGLATVGGRVGYGNTDPVRHQGSFAHEFTHNLGYRHIEQTLGETGWDVGGRLLGNPAENLVASRAMPSSLNDVQVAGRTTAERWVSADKYARLLGNLAFHPFRRLPPPTTAGVASRPARPARRVAVVHGIFDPSGTQLRELRPVLRFPWASQPTPHDPDGPYVVETRTVGGQVLRTPFDAVVGDDAEPGDHTRKGFFEVMVPVVGELERVRILARDGSRTFGELSRSAPPRVRIRSVRSGETLRGRRVLAWSVRDPDTPRDRLRYQVAFSGDGGRTFMPVAVDLAKRSVVFDAARARGRRGAGILRVFVSDGLNTRHADVRRLTVAR